MRKKLKVNSHAHAGPQACCAVPFRIHFQDGMFGARHGRGMGMTWHGKC